MRNLFIGDYNLLRFTLFVSFQAAERKRHLKKGLEIMRTVSVKYSSPNSVLGRFPGFNGAILARSLPAYAYNSATAPNATKDGSLGEITTLDTENIKWFSRLYDTGTPFCVFYCNVLI